MAAALIHADRRTDMTKVIGAFHEQAKAPKNEDVLRYLRVPKSRVAF